MELLCSGVELEDDTFVVPPVKSSEPASATDDDVREKQSHRSELPECSKIPIVAMRQPPLTLTP